MAVDSAADTSWWYDGGGIYRHVNMFPEQFSRLNGGGGDPGQAGRPNLRELVLGFIESDFAINYDEVSFKSPCRGVYSTRLSTQVSNLI